MVKLRSSVLTIFLVLLLTATRIQAQQLVRDTTNSPQSIEAIDERFFQAISDDMNAPSTMQDWLDEVSLLRTFPVRIRKATREALSRIPTLDEMQVQQILLSSDSLMSADPAGDISSTSMQGFASNSVPIATLHLRSRTIIDPNAKSEAGFVNGSFLGPPGEYYNEVKAAAGSFEGALVQAKFPGEPRFDDLIRGFVALSEPIDLARDLSITQLTIGNYKLAYGNGLSFGNTTSSVKTRDPVKAVDPHSSGIEGSVSASSLQGAAASIQFRQASLSAFYSNSPLDATLDSLGAIQSIASTSYHRTTTEIANRYDARAKVIGAHLGLEEPITRLVTSTFGVTGYSCTLDRPISPAASSTKIGTEKESILTMNENAISTTVALNIEEGLSASDTARAFAFVSSLSVKATPDLDLAIEYRNIPANYLTRTTSVFGERSAYGENERGIYLGIDWDVLKEILSLAAYTDLSTTLATTAAVPFPVATNDYLLGATLTPWSDQSLYLQYHRKSKDEVLSSVDSAGIAIGNDGTRTQTNYLAQLSITISKHITLNCEALYVTVENQSPVSATLATGYLLSLGPAVRFSQQFSVECRAIVFSTTNYDARLYEYEPDIPGSATFSPLYTSGIRYFILASLWPAEEVRISGKIAVTRFPASRMIGSGYSAYTGNSDTRIGIQADIRF